MADTIAATPGSGATLASFDDGTGVEWVGSTIGYITGGSAGDWDIQVVDATHGLPVQVLSSALPTGAATAANQATEIASLASIDTKTPALGQALAAASVPVVLTAAQVTTLTPPAAITGFALESGGNLAAAATDLAAIEVLLTTIAGNQLPDSHNVTVDNASLAVTGTFWQATQPVSLASVPSHAVTNAGTFAVQVSSALPAGTNNIGDVDVLSVVPGTSATSLGKAEDAAHSSGDTGVMMLAVRQDSQSSLAADGDYLPPTIDAVGGLRVSIVSGAGSGGTASADDDDFTAGTTSGTPAMGVYESTPSSVTDGDLGVVGITATRAMRVSAAQDGTWTVDLGATDNAVLDAIAASVAGTLTVGSHEVTNAGTFAVQAAQSGTWNIADISGTISLPTGASTLAEQQGQTTHLATIAGDTTAIQAAAELIDDTVATLGTTTYTEATTKGLIVGAVRRDADTTLVNTTNEVGPLQMNAAGQLKVEVFSGETLPVSLTSTTVTGTVAVTQSGTWDEVGINDSGNSLTVDAPVGTPVFVRLSDGSSAITTLPVSLASVPSHAVTNAGTFATQATLQAGTAYAGKVRLTDGTTDTDIRDLTNSNALNVAIVDGSGDQITSFGGGTQYTEGDTDATIAGTAMLMEGAGNALVVAQGTAADGLLVNLGSNNDVTVTNGTAANLKAEVTIAAAQTLATVTTVSTVTTCSTVTTLTGGGIAHDSADSGNPHKIGAKAETALSGITLVADGDRTDLHAGVDGVLITRPHCNLEDIVSGVVAITDGSSTSVISAAGSGVKIYITDVIIANTSATPVTVDLRDGTAGSVKATFPVPENTSGVVKTLAVPLPFSANTAVAADPSASASTITVTLIGFKSKV